MCISEVVLKARLRSLSPILSEVLLQTADVYAPMWTEMVLLHRVTLKQVNVIRLQENKTSMNMN